MSILNKKRKVFGNIAAARTLTESMPKLKLSSSLPSINNNGDTITFLTDLIKSLIGYQALVEVVTDFLSRNIPEIEKQVKKVLKLELKSIVSCGINPSLPAFIKTTGISVEVKKIDFFEIFKIDPNSSSGKLIYDNDFNTFLYGVIQTPSTTKTWKGILDFQFIPTDPNGVNPNNSLLIKANPSYHNKSLNDLNNDYVDSIKLFDTENLVNKIVDIIFGSISVKINKSTKQLEAEGKINKLIDNIVNSDCESVIDDSYFTFTNDEISNIESEAIQRKKGIIKYKTSEEFDVSVPQESLDSFTTEMGAAVNIQEKRTILANNLDSMAEITSEKSKNPGDKQSIKLNFIQLMINNLIKAIISSILSPKVIIIFLITFKIIYGAGADFLNAIDFIKKNKKLINGVMKEISGMIIKHLTTVAMKRITELVAAAQIKKLIDKGKAKTAQLLSLVGVPQEAIRIIKNL